MVEEYYLLLTETSEETNAEAEELPPITQPLSGIFIGCTGEEDEYQQRLEEKYL